MSIIRGCRADHSHLYERSGSGQEAALYSLRALFRGQEARKRFQRPVLLMRIKI